MKFNVKALRKAEADVRSITKYLYERSPQGAAAWLDAYRQARTRLASNADRCGQAEDDKSGTCEPARNVSAGRALEYRLKRVLIHVGPFVRRQLCLPFVLPHQKMLPL